MVSEESDGNDVGVCSTDYHYKTSNILISPHSCTHNRNN